MSQCDWLFATCKNEKTETRVRGFMCMEGRCRQFELALPDFIGRVRRRERLRIWIINLPINMHSCMDNKHRGSDTESNDDFEQACRFVNLRLVHFFSPHIEGVCWLGVYRHS